MTPEGIERPVDNLARAAKLEATERPVSDPKVRVADPKWRFFWCLGPQPSTTPFTTDVPELNKTAVVPAGFETEWRGVMDMWGGRLLAALNTTAEMLALGLGLPRDAFCEKMERGPHLLAPTGADMAKYGSQVGSTMAGYHYDINMLTIHGKSRFPGLFVWTSTGKRIPVAVPPGFLLVQAGIQLEWLTAGAIERGMHEVVVSEKTKQALESALQRKAIPWRVSSTVFGHVRSDASIAPLGHFAQAEGAAEYNAITAGEMVAEQLRALELAT